MLAAMISSTASIVKTSEEKMNAYYQNNVQLENFASPSPDNTINVNITTGDGTGVDSSEIIESPKADYKTNGAFSKTPVVAYHLSAEE